MKRKLSIFVVTIAGIMFLLSGCQKEVTEEPIEITLMHGWVGTLKNGKVMQEIYRDFSKENPDIILKSVPYANNNIAVKEANDMLAVGEVPDILCTNGASYYIDNAVKCGRVMDLMPYIEEDPKWKSEIHPSVFETWETEEGHLYTIPDVLEVAGYWFNEEYLKNAGFVDETGEARVPRTWTEFFEMTETVQKWIQETGSDVSIFTLDEALVIEFLFMARMAGEGEEGLAAARGSGADLSDEMVQKTLEDIRRMGKYSIKAPNVENSRQCFIDGKSVIYFNGVWEAEALEESPVQEQFHYANYPTDSGKSLSYVSASAGYVLAKQEDARKAEASIRFLKYMLSDDVQKKIAVETGQAPSNPNIDKQEIMASSPLLGEAIDTAYRADIQIATIRSVWKDEQINTIIGYLNHELWKSEDAQE